MTDTPTEVLAAALEEWWPEMEDETGITFDYPECARLILALLPEGWVLADITDSWYAEWRKSKADADRLAEALRDIQYTIDSGGPYDMGWIRDRAELAADAHEAAKEAERE